MTVKADSIVTADYVPTLRAFPLFRFVFQKALNAVLFNEYQVIYHAHMIESTVSFIKGFKPSAWKIITLIAKVNKSFPYKVTVITHECTVPAAWSATAAIRLVEPLLFQVILHCQVVRAYSAIHPAGSNQFFSHIL